MDTYTALAVAMAVFTGFYMGLFGHFMNRSEWLLANKIQIGFFYLLFVIFLILIAAHTSWYFVLFGLVPMAVGYGVCRFLLCEDNIKIIATIDRHKVDE